MNHEQTDRFERRIRFLAKHYREDALDAEKAWKEFAFRQGLPLPHAAGRSSSHTEPDGIAANGATPNKIGSNGFEAKRAGSKGIGSHGIHANGAGSDGPETNVIPSNRAAFGGRSFPLGRFVRRYGTAVAAVACLLIGIALFYHTYRSQPDWVAVTTAQGQTKEVYLPDSTLVSLAGHSELRYDRRNYGKGKRVVKMKGKAFFRVEPDSAHPFSVYTSQTEVTVLGTSFQVERRGTATDVAVFTGKVRFADRDNRQEVILTKGMSACYSEKDRTIRVTPDTDPNTLAWKTRELKFENTPLTDVIRTLEHYYHVRLRHQPAATDLKLTATFKDLPLEEVLTVINRTLDIRLTVVSAR